MKTRYFDSSPPRLFAHRGSSADHPENTLPAFAAAWAAGIRYLELDVWATSDGRVVVHHDETTERTCGHGARVADQTFEELQKLDAGYAFSPDGGRSFPFRGRGIRIPSLEELLLAFPNAFCNIEIKQREPSIERLTLKTLKSANAEPRVLLAAEQHQVMKRIRRLGGEIPTSLSRVELKEFFAWMQGGCRPGYRPPGKALQIPQSHQGKMLVSPQTLLAAHSAEMEVHVWTINDPQAMQELLAMGVDGIMSDRPKDLVRVARGLTSATGQN